MVQQGSRQDVVKAIDAEQAYWDRLVESVGVEQMDVPGAMGEWTFKDLAAHILGWRTASLNRLADKVGGVSLPDPFPSSIDLDEYDKINELLYEEHRQRSAEDVLEDVRASYERLRGLVAGASDATLFDPVRGDGAEESYGDAMISGEFFSHLPDEHVDDLETWLASLGKRLPER